MTPTLGQLAAAAPVLARLAAIRVPARVAVALAKLVAAVETETAIYHAQRNAALVEWGTPREATAAERATTNGAQYYDVPPDRVPALLARVADVAAVPVTLPDRLRLPLAWLEGLELSAEEWGAVRVLVDETDDPGEAA